MRVDELNDATERRMDEQTDRIRALEAQLATARASSDRWHGVAHRMEEERDEAKRRAQALSEELEGCDNSENSRACGACVGCYRVGMREALDAHGRVVAERDATEKRAEEAEGKCVRAEGDADFLRDRVHRLEADDSKNFKAIASLRSQLSEAQDLRPRCATCEKSATCVGRYEQTEKFEPACDDCCGHGNEDGRCWPVPEAVTKLAEMLEAAEATKDDDDAAGLDALETEKRLRAGLSEAQRTLKNEIGKVLSHEKHIAALGQALSEAQSREGRERGYKADLGNMLQAAIGTLRGIAQAKRFDREIFADDSAFVDWATSRARWAVAAHDSAAKALADRAALPVARPAPLTRDQVDAALRRGAASARELDPKLREVFSAPSDLQLGSPSPVSGAAAGIDIVAQVRAGGFDCPTCPHPIRCLQEKVCTCRTACPHVAAAKEPSNG